MLVQHLGPPGRGQLPLLLGLFAKIHRSRSQFQVELDRLPLQFAYLEFHALSLRRSHPPRQCARLSAPIMFPHLQKIILQPVHAKIILKAHSLMTTTSSLDLSRLRVRPATASDSSLLILLINSAYSIESFFEGTRTDD